MTASKGTEAALLLALARTGISVDTDDVPSLAAAFEVRGQRAARVHAFPPRSAFPAFDYTIPEMDHGHDD
ncbi:hypothetical protein [Rhizobium sp. Root1204]|uniref:hypothetical protein n=1 Tax=Rhizobium sp. Root1204 TaxID=1736428 RepID=UPI000B181973|nr:hypothetical protein [Rhizobium sp. Root1204]